MLTEDRFVKVTKKGIFNAKSKNMEKKNKQKDDVKVEQLEWFYMSPFEINASMIAELSKEVKFGETELWAELNVLELILAEKSGADFAMLINSFEDECDMDFIVDRGIKSIFAVTFNNCTLEDFKPFVQHLLEKWKGIFCADTFDFNPRFENKSM